MIKSFMIGIGCTGCIGGLVGSDFNAFLIGNIWLAASILYNEDRG